MKKKNMALLRRKGGMQASYLSLALLAAVGATSPLLAWSQEVPANQSSGGPAPEKRDAEETKNAQIAKDGKSKAGDAPEVVIVTGVMAKTVARKANVAYSVLDKEEINMFTPISATDILRDMPGVFVDSSEGEARTMVYTRGMAIGSDSPTSGWFWASLLEDGLPVLPVKFSGFQDGQFYRSDISTNKVESVRGGTTGTTLASSTGGVFNFLSASVRPGASLQTRLSLEGEDLHLSTKQVDGYYGWLNEAGDLGFNVTGFFRSSNGANNPGFALNHGGQVKSTIYKEYRTAKGSGTFNLTFKHLDDRNAGMSNQLPTYGYENVVPLPGFNRDSDLFLHGGEHDVAISPSGEKIHHKPENGYRNAQDAVWLRWEHSNGGPWSFSGAVKSQKTYNFGERADWNGLFSLWSNTAFQNPYGVNQGVGSAQTANLNRQNGHYELYDINSGDVRAKIFNNAGTAQGINYRTGTACAAGTLASPVQCVAFNDLPLRNYDMRGGTVNVLINGVLTPVVVPALNNTSNQDVVVQYRSELSERESRDNMLNFTTNYRGSNFNVNGGLFVVKAHQKYDIYGAGFGLSPIEDGGSRLLGARFVTATNGTYQLTDEGGWGKASVGGSRAHSTHREISPYFSAAWSPSEKWDLNGSAKFTRIDLKSNYATWVQNPESQSLASRTFGGVDGNAKTWYDNAYFVPPTAAVIARKSANIHNWSVSAGYNINNNHKIYYRQSFSQNSIPGTVQRYTTPQSLLLNKFQSGAQMEQKEFSWNMKGKGWSGAATVWDTEQQYPTLAQGLNIDNTPYLTEQWLNKYRTRGLETWLKWRPMKNLEMYNAITYTTGKTVAQTTVNFGAQGPQDDVYTTISGFLAKTAPLLSSNRVTYRYNDVYFNVRHRWISKRRQFPDPTDRRHLSSQNNFDLSVQYKGIPDTYITLEVRNVTNNQFRTSYDSFLTRPSTVTARDIYEQLPDSASWVKMNPSRSLWLTMKKDF